MTDTHPILIEIEAFLSETGMSASAFGALAANDRNLVHQLRSGRFCFPKTEAKVREAFAKVRAQRASEDAA